MKGANPPLFRSICMKFAKSSLLLGALLSGMLLATPVSASADEGKPEDEKVEIRNLSGAFLAARTAEMDNDTESAIRFYKTALALDSDNKKVMQSLMTLLVVSGRLEEATPIAEQLKTEPEAERLSRLLLAVNAINAKQFRSSETLLKFALQSDLDRLVSQVMTAWAKFGGGDAQDAIDHLENLNGPIWYGLFTKYHSALIADAAGLESARTYYAKTGEMADEGRSAPDTYLRFIEAHAAYAARRGDLERANEVLDQSKSLVTFNPRIDAMRQRLESNPPKKTAIASARQGSAEILLNVATAINRPGSGPFALYYLQLADSLRKNDDSTMVQIAAFYESLGKSEKAIGFYNRVPDGSPLKRVAETQLGLNLADLEKYDESEEHLVALIEEDPTDTRAILSLAGVYSTQKDYEKLAELMDRAVEEFPNPTREHWNLFYQRGIAYERIKQWEKAEPNFLKALELYPAQPQVLNYLGYTWVDMNIKLEEGLDLIREAVALRPRDGYIVDSLGWAYYRLGRFEEAVVELERAVSLKPDDPIINDHLGDAYWRAGRQLEATFQWRHAKDMEPEPDVLEQIEKKLAEGMPPLENNNSLATPGPKEKETEDTRG